MDTISEDYCSFEIAKLLSEKGFCSDECVAFYKPNKEFGLLQTFGDIAEYDEETCILTPTIQMACKWLIKKYNLFCDIGYDDLEYNWQIIDISADSDKQPAFVSESYGGYSEHPYAAEAGIKYCLEHLI